MRAQLTFVLLLGFSGVAAAQHVDKAQHHPAPIAGSVPELPPIGLPLPSVGLPHPATGLPPVAVSPKPYGGRQGRRTGSVYHGSRRLPSAVYFVPAFVDSVIPYAPEAAPPVEAVSPPAGGQLRVEVSPGVLGQVYLDGYYVGTTDDLGRPMDVVSGRHSIEIRADGYQPAQDDIAVAAGRSVTYRAPMTRAPEPDRAAAVVESRAPKTFYVIPGCYVGDIRPEEGTVPAACDPRRAIAVRR